VTLTLPVAPLPQVAVQVNVPPFWTLTSLGHFTLVTSELEVESCCLIPDSTAESSTVRVGAELLDSAVPVSESLPHAPRTSAPATRGVMVIVFRCPVGMVLLSA
jgi:hypothetical protein